MSVDPPWWSGWLTVSSGVLAIGMWAFNALMLVATDAQLSTKPLYAWIALGMTGVAVGIGLGALMAPRLARRPTTPYTLVAANSTDRLLTGIWLLGLALYPVYGDSLDALGWAILVIGALGGGGHLGLASTPPALDSTKPSVPPSATHQW